MWRDEGEATMMPSGTYPSLIATRVLGSEPTICVTPRGREAGEIPAQSRYGERPSGGRESGRRPHGACSNLREKGRQDRVLHRLTPPFGSRVRSEGSRDPSRPLRSRSARRRGRAVGPGALLSAVLLILAACTGASPSVAPSASSVAVASPTAVPTVTASPTPVPAFPATVIDDEGTSVLLASEPRKIVSLTPATTEILFALGAGPRVIATTDFDDYPPEAVALPDVASYTTVDVEKIVGLGADLVIAGGNFFNPPAAVAQLRGLGIPVIVVYAPDIGGVLKDITLIGSAIGLPDAAARMTATMQAGFDAVSTATAGLPRPRTFYELDTSTGTIYTVADRSFGAEMVTLAGGDPITTGSPTDYAISLEKLIKADPALILLGDAAYGVTAEQVKSRAGWKVMTAVKTGAIQAVNDLVITRPGPRLVEGLRDLALAIHPGIVLPSAAPIPAAP